MFYLNLQVSWSVFMFLSMVWIKQLNTFPCMLIAVYVTRAHSGYPLNGLLPSPQATTWGRYYSSICVSVKEVSEHAVNILEVKNEAQFLLFYWLTLRRMSSEEEKSTSPVLPKDSVRGSSVSSDIQVGKGQPHLIHCYSILDLFCAFHKKFQLKWKFTSDFGRMISDCHK